MADKILDAVFSVSSEIDDELDDITEAAEGAAAAFEATEEAVEEYTDAVEEAEDETDAFGTSLDAIFESAAQATAGIEGATEAADEMGDQAAESTLSAAGYGASFEYVSDSAGESITPQLATAATMGVVGEKADKATEEVLEYASSLSTLSGVSVAEAGADIDAPGVETPSPPDVETPDADTSSFWSSLRDIDISAPTIDTSVERPSFEGVPLPSFDFLFGGGGGGGEGPDLDTEEQVQDLQRALAGLPEIPYSGENLQQLTADLSTAREEARETVGVLSLLDVDISGVSTVGALASEMDEGSEQAQEFAEDLRSVSGASRAFLNSGLETAESTEELSNEVNRLSSRTDEAIAKIQRLEGATGGLLGEAIALSTTTNRLADAVDEYGDEATEAALETLTLDAAMEALGLGETSFFLQLGPLATRISSVSKAALPLIGTLGALVSAIGAVGTAAAGAGAAGFGIFAGGMMVLAQQAAARKEAMLAASGKELTPEQANVTMSEGMEIVSGNIKEQLKEATAPLRQPAFAQLTLGGIEALMTVINDFSVFSANLAPALSRVGAALMEVYNAVAPEIWSELTKTVLTFLPVIQQLLTGALRALPGVLRFMRQQGKQLIPMLMEFGGAVIEILPPLLRLGSAILQFLIPAMTFATNAVTPFIRMLAWLGGVVSWLADLWTAIPQPIREAAATVVGLAYAVSQLTTVLSLLGVMSGSISTLGALGTIAGYAWTAISALGTVVAYVGGIIAAVLTSPVWGTVAAVTALIAAVAGVITYFGWWDEIVSGFDWALGGIADLITWLASLVGLGDEVTWFFQGVDYWVRRLAGALRILEDAWNAVAGLFDWFAGSTDEWVGRLTDDRPGQSHGGGDGGGGDGGGGGGDGGGGAAGAAAGGATKAEKAASETPFPEAQTAPPGQYPGVNTGTGIYNENNAPVVGSMEITAPKNANAPQIRNLVRRELERFRNENRTRSGSTN